MNDAMLFEALRGTGCDGRSAVDVSKSDSVAEACEVIGTAGSDTLSIFQRFVH
jgi:hypothetical protein